MSDNDDISLTNSDNSDSDSDNEPTKQTNKKAPFIKQKIGINDNNNDNSSDSDSDSNFDSGSESDEDDILGNNLGKGKKVSDELEEGEIEEEDEEDEDDEDDEDDEVELDENGDPIESGSKAPASSSKQKKQNQLIIQDDPDDEDDEYDEHYLQKFDSELTKNYINEFHPESLIHNADEISKMATVFRSSDNIIVDPFHKTIPILTKYEKARILGQRAKQIESGAKPFVKLPENVIDSYIIAELELKEKKIPFIIRRPIPGGGCEYWHLNDLENIHF